jgi:carbamoylphosphate synthase large subunit
MKSTGEVMAIGNNLQLAILKAIRSLEEETKDLLPTEQIKNSKTNILLKNIGTATDIRI